MVDVDFSHYSHSGTGKLTKTKTGRRTEHASLKTHRRDSESFNTWKTVNWRHPRREEDQGGRGETVLVIAMEGGKTHCGNKGTVNRDKKSSVIIILNL